MSRKYMIAAAVALTAVSAGAVAQVEGDDGAAGVLGAQFFDALVGVHVTRSRSG